MSTGREILWAVSTNSPVSMLTGHRQQESQGRAWWWRLDHPARTLGLAPIIEVDLLECGGGRQLRMPSFSPVCELHVVCASSADVSSRVSHLLLSCSLHSSSSSPSLTPYMRRVRISASTWPPSDTSCVDLLWYGTDVHQESATGRDCSVHPTYEPTLPSNRIRA